MSRVTKSDVLSIFGSVKATAEAVGVTSSAVSQWPDPLPRRIEDRVLGAMGRIGVSLPDSEPATVSLSKLKASG